MNTGFSPRRRKTDFAKCKILGRFCVVSFRVSTICIVLVENTVVLRVQIQSKGEQKMKKANLFQDTLERQIQDLLASYPDPMGRTDFRKACRIGTRTSLYLLQSGLVPCENTGKQTRCYKIAKADVAAYLRRRLVEPEYYTPPSGWYKNYPGHEAPAFGLNGALLLTDATRRRVRRWYETLLARQPDVLDARQIARVTGYGARTVSHWCNEGRLRAFSHQHTYKVPKEWLLEFLTSEDYNSITRKSKAHYAMIAAVTPKPRKSRKKP